MPTVPIDVVTYRRMFVALTDIAEAINPKTGIENFIEDYDDLPIPDYICNSCGHIDDKVPDNCSRCGNII